MALLVGLTVFAGVAAESEPMSVAVLNFRLERGVSHVVANQIAAALREEMEATGKYTVMPAGEMAGVFVKQKARITAECDSAQCIARLGKMLGVSKVVDGVVAKQGRQYTLKARLVDVVAMADVGMDGQGFASSNESDVILGAQKLAARLAEHAKPVDSTAGMVKVSEYITVPDNKTGNNYTEGVRMYNEEMYKESMKKLEKACKGKGGNENLYAEANALRGMIYQFHSDDPDRFRKAYLAYRLALDWNARNKIALENIGEMQKRMREKAKEEKED